MILGNYTFASFLWDVLVIFAFVIWFWLLIGVFGKRVAEREIATGQSTPDCPAFLRNRKNRPKPAPAAAP